MKKLFYFMLILASLSACDTKPEAKTYYTGNQKEAIIDNILTRRSIRKYTGEQVTKA